MLVKCLSIRQPFATLIMTGLKVEEFRSWPTKHRGPLAIHASKTLMLDRFAEFPHLDPKRIQRGVILGIVDVVDCQDLGVYEGGFAWILANPRWLPKPMPMKGMVGLFNVEIDESLFQTS